MKKIIALAVASAFVAPVMAADVTISGLSEFYFKDSNGSTETGFGDHALYVEATTETANGWTVSVDMNIDVHDAESSSASYDKDDDKDVTDGSDSINISGPFGKIELGDTSNATDKFDDRTDKDVVIDTISMGADDAAVSWTLPTFVEGLTTYVSYSADSNREGNKAGSGIALQYVAGPVTVAYGQVEGDVDTNSSTYAGGTVKFGGLAISAERYEEGASGAEATEQAIGFTYTMGDLTFAVSQEETKDTSDAVTDDVTFMGIKYSLGGGVTAFAETSSNDKDASDDVTAVGVAYSF